MKKTHWLRNTLIVLVACGLLGTVLAIVQFNKEAGRTSASATVQFSFKGAEEGKAPNGYPFEVGGITSDEVLNTALEMSGLTGKYTAEQLQDSITVTGVYPQAIVERMTQYISLLDKEAESQAVVTDYHATEYNVTLYNDFDPSVSSGTMTELLGNILTVYRAYFAKTYGTNLNISSAVPDLQEYDYAQQLETLPESTAQESRYAREMAEKAPEFRADGKGFSDIAVRYDSISGDIDSLKAFITLNAVSKNPERLKLQYEAEIRTQQFKLDSLNEELQQIEEQIKVYDKDGIIYVSAGSILTQIGNDKSGTYDKLVKKHKEVTDQIAVVKAKISLYKGRLEDVSSVGKAENEEESTSAVLTEAEKKARQETAEKKMGELSEKKNAVSCEFAAMLDAYTAQEINERTVSATAVNYYKPSILSGAFIIRLIKTAGPFCAIGFMACMMLLIRDRKKEEKAKAV